MQTSQLPSKYSLEGILYAIARGTINSAIADLKKNSEHLTEQDKLDLLQILQMEGLV